MKKYLNLLSVDVSRKLARALFFWGGLSTILFSYLFRDATGIDAPLWDRWVVGLFILGLWGASFTRWLPQAKLNIVFGLTMVLMTLQSAYANYQADFSPALLITELLIVQYFFLVLNRRVQVWGYFALVNLSWLAGIAFGDQPLLWSILASLVVLLISLANAMVGLQRIQAFEDLKEQEQQAAASQQTLQAVQESSQDMIWSLDREHRLMTFNQAFAHTMEQIFGFKPAKGMAPPSEYAYEGSHARFGPYYEQALQGQTINLEARLKIGEVFRWLSITFNPIWADDEVVGLANFARDITEFKANAAELIKFRQAIEGTSEAIGIANPKGEVVFLNPAFRRLTGYTPAALNQLGIPNIYAEPEKMAKHLQALMQAGRAFREEVILYPQAGTSLLIDLKANPIWDEAGQLAGFMGLHTDITERRELQASLRSILDSSLSGIMAFRAVRNQARDIVDFEWMLANEAALSLIHQSEAALIGSRLLDLMPGHLAEGLFQRYCHVVETGLPTEFEHFYDHEAITATWFQSSVAKLGDGFVVTFSDITRRKETQQKLRTLSLVAEQTEAAVVITDADQVIEWVNEGYARLTGYDPAEVVGLKVGAIMQGPATDQEESRKVGVQLRQGKPASAELLNYRKDGSPYWVALNINPIFDEAGHVVRFIAVETEITARKEAEQALRQAKEEAERVAQAKADFLATMSHEIRTPMNAVIGMTGLLLETDLNEEQRDYVKTIRLSGDNLLTIINDILDFSKIDAGHMALEAQPFQVRSAIADVLDLLAGQAQAHHIGLHHEIEAGVPPVIIGDPARLNQVLVNLINNAIKFTEQGEVLIRLRRLWQKGDDLKLEFRIQDTGIGISATQIERLFQPFSQGDASTTRKYGGTGLGLVISRRLVELMGGEITVKSEVGKGSTFIFTLLTQASASILLGPSDQLGPQPSGHDGRLAVPPFDQEALATRSMPGLSVLLVEDNLINQKVALRMLSKLGYEADIAANGLEAIKALELRRYDLVFMDMQMPEMDGITATQELRQRYPHPPARPVIIAMTANAMQGDRERCLAAGMDDYISKPIKKEKIAEAILRWHGEQAGA